MAAVLAAAMAVVTVYCVARLAVPMWRDEGHPFELDVLHFVMGVCMVAMLLEVLPGGWHSGVLVVFAGAAVRCFARSFSGRARQLYARFGVVCVGMLAMLVPHSAKADGSPSARAAPATTAGHHAMGSGLGAPDLADLSTWAVIVALMAMMSVASAAVLQLGSGRQTMACRLGTACEIAMATSMGYLLAMGLVR